MTFSNHFEILTPVVENVADMLHTRDGRDFRGWVWADFGCKRNVDGPELGPKEAGLTARADRIFHESSPRGLWALPHVRSVLRCGGLAAA